MSTIQKPKTVVPIRHWADLKFPVKPPHQNTLLRWIAGNHIKPMPEKIGKGWFVVPHAEYVS